MKKNLVKVVAGIAILVTGCFVTYVVTVNQMVDVANARVK